MGSGHSRGLVNIAALPNAPLKPSGVEWLGDLPAHWEMYRLRNVVDMRVSNVDKHVNDNEISIRLCNYVDVYKNDYINERMDFMRATATNEEIERFRLEKDDVLITKDSETWDDIGVPALVREAADDLIAGYHLALLRPQSDKIVGAYLLRALQSTGLAYQFHIAAKGVTRYGLSHAGIKSVWLPLPSLPEQTAIARFLDHADRRIRRYIRAKEKLIALLEEERQAVISEAVTGRIDVRTGQPYPAYKPSGVEWLGDVPAHWEVRRLASCIDQIQSGAREQSEVGFNNGVPNLGGEHIGADNQLLLRNMRYVSCQFFENLRKGVVQQDDILLVKDGATIGKVAFVREMPYEKCSINEHVYIIRPTHNILSPLLFYNIRSSGIQDGLWQEVTGSAQPGLNSSFTKSLSVALPPLPEQTAIVEYLDKATAEIAAAITRARRQVELLQEYRTRLIADVVTGKLAVREAPAQFPEKTGVRKPSTRRTY